MRTLPVIHLCLFLLLNNLAAQKLKPPNVLLFYLEIHFGSNWNS